jgi:integrase
VTLANQAELWLRQLAHRTRRPVSLSTLHTYRSLLNSWVLPRLGPLELSDVTNATLKILVEAMSRRGMSAVTIQNTVYIAREIVRSDRDVVTGERLHKLDFDAEFVGLPFVDRAKQKKPTATATAIESAIANGRQYSTLYTLLAGTGLRIGEALDIRVGPSDATYWDPERRLIRVQTSRVRDVDLPDSLNDFLLTEALRVGRRHKDKLFQTTEDGARLELAKSGIRGFRVFRRFRELQLRQAQVPENLIRHWMGLSCPAGYADFSRQLDVRREWASRAGLGFALCQRAGHSRGSTT